VTGSIGIFFGKLDAVELARRLDVTTMQLARGRRAGMGSLYRPYTPDERAMLADKIRHWYGLFLERVAEGRPLTVREVDAVGRGRIWSGDAALRHGLVDRLGGFASALARARELGGLSPDAPAVMVPSRPSGLIDYVLGSSGVSADDAPIGGERAPALRWPAPLRAAARFGATLGHGSDGIPMALLPAHIEIR
jgi:protease-4